jgi:hypothetical protein
MHIWIKIVVLEYYNIVVSSNAIGKDMIVNRECGCNIESENQRQLWKDDCFLQGGNERNEWD